MAGKNKLLIIGAMMVIATVGQSKIKEIKNEDTVMFMEENEKEANDDLFVEFVDGKTTQTSEKNIELVSQTNINTKKNKLDKNITRKRL